MKETSAITTILLLLGVLSHLPSSVFSKTWQDSIVMGKVFSYKKDFAKSLNIDTSNTYIKYNFRVIKRNHTLLFVPSMYYIAKGRHDYVGEVYGKAKFYDVDRFDMYEQVKISTIPHNHKTMSTMAQYLTPNIYGVAIFRDNILSPFNYDNRIFYCYRVSPNKKGQACVTFSPRLKNTQLISGYAIVDEYTGRILRSMFRGERDMINFNVYIDMGENRTDNSLIPERCEASALFKFAGNEICTGFKVFYNCPTTLPDSIRESQNVELMSTLRPDTLSTIEKEVYHLYEEEQNRRDSMSQQKQKYGNRLKTTSLNILGDYLLNSHGVENSKASINLSPLINPLYFSYSHSRGLAYKLRIGARYSFSGNMNISLSPDFGYNFKIRQFYFTSPLRFTYNHQRNGWIELLWANGNRITNSDILDIIRDERRDTINFESLNLDYFKDEMWRLTWNTPIIKCLSMRIGSIFHRRTAINKADMESLGKFSEYRSFAPFVTLTFCPSPQWPVFTGNYERSVKKLLRSNTEYERWEFDASYKKQLKCLRQYSLRFGGGFYTNKSSNYFVDFENFHENYIPGGWDDDWSGDFQLLNSQWYNVSKFYIRANISYESPLLALTWLPLVGKYIETERLYLNILHIEHTRPYYEIGYRFTTRYFSVGLFGSFLNGNMHEIGSKFTFELFRKW